MDNHFDVVVIGGGVGGYTCASQLSAYGLNTAVVERDVLGGTCLNRGCIPTKTLLHAADLFSEICRAEVFGLTASKPAVDYPALRKRKEEVILTLRDGVQKMLRQAKVTVIEGEAFVPESGFVDVTQKDGSVVRLTADDLVVATGSVPSKPPIPGLDLPGILTSDDILGNVPELASLVIIGGGVIGMEFASFYSSVGTGVTVLEALPGILPGLDREFGQSLSMLMKKRGVTVKAGAMVKSVRKDEGGFVVSYEAKGKTEEAKGEAVLVSTGRRVVLDQLFFPEALPSLERGRAVTDAAMRSSVPHVYVIGDAAAGTPQLAHTASAQGLAAAAAIAGKPFETDLSLIPSCVYTQPEISSVGLSEAEAKEKGISVHTGKYPTNANGKSVLSAQDRGFIKLVAEDGTGRLLGAQFMCAHATDMIGEAAAAIASGLTEKQFASFIRPHPTFEESIGEAARVCAEKGEQCK